jgi:hypothetical protein
VVQTALTANQPDLSKAGVVGQAPSSKIVKNVMNNYSNNATVDSIDNGVNATIRVYGPGGPGTTWHQFIGAAIGPENAAFSGTAAYDTDFNVYSMPATCSTLPQSAPKPCRMTCSSQVRYTPCKLAAQVVLAAVEDRAAAAAETDNRGNNGSDNH